MSARKKCDLCGKNHTKARPIRDFQITAKIEAFDAHENVDDLDELAYERLDLCGVCITDWSTRVKEFIAVLVSVRDMQWEKEAKEAGEV